MKSKHVCPKCDHNKILYVPIVVDRSGQGNFVHAMKVAPVKKEGFLLEYLGSEGNLEAYICKGCGYTEFFTRNVEEIPVDGELVSELTGPAPKPFR